MHQGLVLDQIDRKKLVWYNITVRWDIYIPLERNIMKNTEERQHGKHHRSNRYGPAGFAFWWRCQWKSELQQLELASAHGPFG